MFAKQKSNNRRAEGQGKSFAPKQKSGEGKKERKKEEFITQI